MEIKRILSADGLVTVPKADSSAPASTRTHQGQTPVSRLSVSAAAIPGLISTPLLGPILGFRELFSKKVGKFCYNSQEILMSC